MDIRRMLGLFSHRGAEYSIVFRRAFPVFRFWLRYLVLVDRQKISGCFASHGVFGGVRGGESKFKLNMFNIGLRVLHISDITPNFALKLFQHKLIS